MLQRRGLDVTALPPNPLCGAESVEKAAAFATTWCNELAVAIQHILHEMNLETGAFMARALISHHAHHGERKASSTAKKGQKWKRRFRKGLRDKELAAEGVQYEAEERWTAGLTLTHDFHLPYSSSIVLPYPKLDHFFDQIRAISWSLNHYTSFVLHPTPINLSISCRSSEKKCSTWRELSKGHIQQTT